jgi:hypothetical protein
MESDRRELVGKLEAHYRGSGWSVKRGGDGTIHASGPGGVTWIAAAILPSDLEDAGTGQRLREMAERRMEGGGELCPLELLPSVECADELKALLDRIGLSGRKNVAVYSLAA